MGGGGGSSQSSQTYDDLKPKTPEQIALENQFYGLSNQVMQGQQTGDFGSNYFGQLMNQAADRQQANYARRDELAGQSQYLADASNYMLGNAAVAGDDWYNSARDAYERANSMIRQSDENSRLATETNKWYDQYAQGQLTNAANLLQTGDIPQELENRMMESINRGMKGSMGSMLNDLAGRGVINSSIGSQGISRLGQQAADAYNDGYLNTFNTVLGGYQGNAQTAAQDANAFANMYMDFNNQINSGAQTAINLGQSYVDAGAQRVNDSLGVAEGFTNNYNSNLAEREQLMNEIPQYWENATSSYMPAYNYLQNQQADRAKDTRTTVVTQKQGGKK